MIGLTPYKFELDATAYIGASGQTALGVAVAYDTLLGNRLILQSTVEAEWFGENDARRGVHACVNIVEAGFRLRYEVTRQFAPYHGVVHERAFGAAADRRRADGDGIDDTRVVAGIRIWF